MQVPLTENHVIIFDIGVAWVQGNNVDKRLFFIGATGEELWAKKYSFHF